jgi:sulfate adenylyltransferase large subunit
MTARPDQGAFALDTFLHQQERKSLLRFIACGSVDHGKSTLIGRLLYEAGLLFDDQLDALAIESRKHGTQGKELDFSLILDGLAAEREQKITIDVAYRFFSTERRKFIVADAPGHEQYTRNMATGASTADLALILINAQTGLTRQTRRHSLIVSTLGVRQLLIAVNMMDLVGWSEEAFRVIETEFRSFAAELGVSEIVCIPISARSGDNVVSCSRKMDWYRGPTLLAYLEDVEITAASHRRPFRMPVQLVNRPSPDFRGYSGLIASGEVYAGMPVRILPSGQTSYIDRIVTFDGDVDQAAAGKSVTVTLADDVDASRGDVIAEIGEPPVVSDRVSARVFWMGKDALVPGRSYLVKLATSTAKGTVDPTLCVLDIDTRASAAVDRLLINDIGQCVLALDRPVAVDRYIDNKETGSFIMIDTESCDTVGIGLVEQTKTGEATFGWLRRRLSVMAPARAAGLKSPRSGESHIRSIAKAISWRGSGSLDTFLVTLVITGSYTFAGSIAVTEIMTKITLYYFHERIWSLIPWGNTNPPVG